MVVLASIPVTVIWVGFAPSLSLTGLNVSFTAFRPPVLVTTREPSSRKSKRRGMAASLKSSTNWLSSAMAPVSMVRLFHLLPKRKVWSPLPVRRVLI